VLEPVLRRPEVGPLRRHGPDRVVDRRDRVPARGERGARRGHLGRGRVVGGDRAAEVQQRAVVDVLVLAERAERGVDEGASSEVIPAAFAAAFTWTSTSAPLISPFPSVSV
jgi:hypothetical protein